MSHSFSASLLRERFVIRDITAADDDAAAPIVALSNRLAVPLGVQGGLSEENFVVRAQNMHTCARYAARVAQDYAENGRLIGRKKPFDWEYAWLSIAKVSV